MKIKELKKNSPVEIFNSIIPLLHEQMTSIGSTKKPSEIKRILRNALKKGLRCHVVYVENRAKEIVGFSFFNLCFGIQSEGLYVWINEIGVKKENRKEGVGKLLLSQIVKWSKKKKCKYIAGQTWLSNNPSKKLFLGQGFKTSNVIWMDKELSDNG